VQLEYMARVDGGGVIKLFSDKQSAKIKREEKMEKPNGFR
jgi:hypothetical protein